LPAQKRLIFNIAASNLTMQQQGYLPGIHDLTQQRFIKNNTY
jgi:hypothetical protein